MKPAGPTTSAAHAAPLPTCLVCGAHGPTPYRRVPSVDGGPPFTLHDCSVCKSLFFDLHEHGPLDRETLYNQHSPAVTAFVRSPYWAAEADTIVRVLGHPPRSALDVGSRDGSFLLHFPSETRKTGIELSLEQAAVAEARGVPTVTKAVEEAEFAEPFDVVTAYAVLEHLPDPLRTIDRLCDLVADSGVFALLVPTHRCAKRLAMDVLGKTWHHYQPPLHATFFGPSFLASYIESRGFRLVRRKYTTGGQRPNPFRRVPVIRKVVRRAYDAFDGSPLLTRLPIFDHLYLYFAKRS